MAMPRKSNRRELIISIATTRFLIAGYDVVTVDELCELSSSTKGSFYHFFPNKESLAVDVVNEVWHQTQIDMDAIFVDHGDIRQQLHDEIERIAASYCRFDGKRHFIGCPIGTLSISLRSKSLKITRRLTFALNHMRQYYVAAFEQAIKQGQIDGSTPAATQADLFQISLQGLSTLGKAHASNTKIREMADQLKSTIC